QRSTATTIVTRRRLCTLCLSNAPTPPCFFSDDSAATELSTLSLHDALPILAALSVVIGLLLAAGMIYVLELMDRRVRSRTDLERSEEHTSELQSPYELVCRLLLEKKKKQHALYSSACHILFL